MSFKDNLKNQLEYSGMYVKELAARSGVKKQTIDGYLNVHEYTPSAENAVKIARALGVSVEYLVTGEEPAAGKPALPPHSAGLWLPL
ncbi:MAG: helix-turn-helix domain-containing protein, partial [Spirochaetaceae bacterium]|nr:helix-turn-helix domain-containing protein [Spirochaetaceae bacterium]